MIEPLEQPRAVRNADGLLVVATHRAWGMTHQLWNKPELLSYSVLGQYRDDRFRPIAGTEEETAITEGDYAQLLAPTDAGKQADNFRADDVRAIHRIVAARDAVKHAARLELERLREARDRAEHEKHRAFLEARDRADREHAEQLEAPARSSTAVAPVDDGRIPAPSTARRPRKRRTSRGKR